MNDIGKKTKRQKGQVMLIVSITLGTLALTTAVMSGLLMFFELQNSNNSALSAMAIFAADSGIERSLNCYYQTGDVFSSSDAEDYICKENGTLSNGASYNSKIWCVGKDMTKLKCTRAEVSGFRVKSVGTIRQTERILESFYATKFN